MDHFLLDDTWQMPLTQCYFYFIFFSKLSIPECLRPKDADICYVDICHRQGGSQLGRIEISHFFRVLQCPGTGRTKLGSGLEPRPVVQTQLSTVCCRLLPSGCHHVTPWRWEQNMHRSHCLRDSFGDFQALPVIFSITSISVGQTW